MLRFERGPRSERVLRWVSTAVRLGLGAVFLIAGALKVADPVSSVQAVRAYEILPGRVAEVVGYGLPFAEIALGLLLVAGIVTRVMGWLSIGALVVFIVAMVSAWARGLSIDCGCFGGGGEVAPGQAPYLRELLRDLGFLVLAVWLVVHPRSMLSLDRGADRPG